MNAHVEVRRVAVDSNSAAPYDLDAEGQPILRSDAEKVAILKAEIEAALAEDVWFTSEEVEAYLEERRAERNAKGL